MGGRAKLDEAQVADFRARAEAGATVPELMAAFGLSRGGADYHLARAGLRPCDMAEDHPRRLALEARRRAPGRKAGNAKLSDEVWIELLTRRLRGERDEDLAAEYGVRVGTIRWRAGRHGMRKKDHAEAVDRRFKPHRGEPPLDAEVRARLLSGYEPGNTLALIATADEGLVELSQAGRWRDLRELKSTASALVAYDRMREREFARLGRVGEAAHAPPLEPLELAPAQQPPEGDWTTWLFLGGRGAGKTLAGAEWLADQAERLGPGGRLALIGPTLHDVREVMIEGVSGLKNLPRWAGGARPVFEASRRRVRFPGGALAYAFSAEDPDSLRGPQFSAAWADEFCAWGSGGRKAGETLALLRMGLRLPGSDGAAPRLCVTTTPRATPDLKALRAEPGLAETHRTTAENAAWLAPGFVEGLERLYGGTRKAAQELEGRVVELDGGLWSEAMLEACPGTPPDRFERVVVAVDPTTTAGGHACGIVVAGKAGETAWVLADRSCAGLTPGGWAQVVGRAAEDFEGACVVVEVNQGGTMVRDVLRAAGVDAPLREVRASKGKRARAEPVAALYEQGRVRHAAPLRLLAEELRAVGTEEETACDLDRADALVWAVTDLLLGERVIPRIRAVG